MLISMDVIGTSFFSFILSNKCIIKMESLSVLVNRFFKKEIQPPYFTKEYVATSRTQFDRLFDRLTETGVIRVGDPAYKTLNGRYLFMLHDYTLIVIKCINID
jgi:hypothetical protein